MPCLPKDHLACGLQMPSQVSETDPEVEKTLKQYSALNASISPSARKTRERLIDAVNASPASPEPWLSLLKYEEQHQEPQTNISHSQLRGDKGGVTLYRLFSMAIQKIPRHSNYRNHAYLQIWLGYARQQRYVDFMPAISPLGNLSNTICVIKA